MKPITPIVVAAIGLLTAACGSPRHLEPLAMTAQTVGAPTSGFEAAVWLGEVEAFEDSEPIGTAIVETLKKNGLAAATEEQARYVLSVAVLRLNTDNDDGKVSATAKLQFKVAEKGTDKRVLFEEIDSTSKTFSAGKSTQVSEGLTKSLLFLLLVPQPQSFGLAKLEFSAERAHRVAKQDAIRKTIERFVGKLTAAPAEDLPAPAGPPGESSGQAAASS